MSNATRLSQIFAGWNGYQTSLVHAAEPLSKECLTWRPAEGRRSVGETMRHVALGRITWFARMNGPGLEQAVARVPQWVTDRDGARHAVEEAVPMGSAADLIDWLELTWQPINAALNQWTVEDLSVTFRHRFMGKDYAVSRQWVLWRIMAHDIHHGGQLAMMLAMQGLETMELGLLGGHIIEPPLYVEEV